MASSAETYCLCGQPYNVGQFMIECDCCREWFHGSCVNVKVYQSEDIDKYHCPKCVPTYGPSIYRVPTNDHRQDRYELNADRKPLQAGSRAFVAGLSQKRFSQEKHVIVLHGHQFTELYLKDTGFNKPLQFENSAGLDLRVPPANTFSVRTVARHCGASKEIDVIDVTRQTNFKMALGDFVDYFTSPPEERGDKVLNVLSLEFSDTPMCSVVWPPLMARQLDWVRVVWPPEASPQSPLVQRYCIMSPSGAYTDFHVDFGGTTVWYHVLHGQKVFYFIPPTATNLALYQQWSSSPNQSEVFFGDLVESCTSCTLKRGQTLFIPTGWIHAVWTPEDSLVFGGNFLHSLNIELQLQVNEIEKQIDTPTIFRFPGFETIHWYAGAHLLQQLRRINEEQQDKDFIIGNEGIKEGLEVQKKSVLDLPPYLVRGVRILAAALKEWNACKSYDQSKKDNIPDTINSSQLVRELAKELRRLEKLLPQAQPVVLPSPVPKRKKKKPKPEAKPVKVAPQQDRHFASVSNSKHLPEPPLNYDPSNPRTLYNQHSTSLPPMPKKSLKLTLPKPIMHVPDSNHMFSNSSQDSEDAELNNMANLACRSGMASYSQGYDSQDSFGGDNDYRGENDYRVPGESMEHDGRQKKNPYTELTSNERGGAVLKIKLGSPPSTSMEGSPRPPPNHGPPPDYATTEHSILKSHLIGNSSTNALRQQQKPSNHWTISKSQVKNNINDSTDEQILFTNENLTMPGTSHSTVTSYVSAPIPFNGNGMLYGPGMYATEDIHNNTTQIVQQDNNYDPEYVIDRKNNGILPDYSPTKSINEYTVQNKVVPFIDQVKIEDVKMQFHLASSFANNSDPYSQGMRAQDGASPFSGDDSTVLTGTDGYRLIQDDAKSGGVVQGRMEMTEYVTDNPVYDYVDCKGNLYKSEQLLDVKKEHIQNILVYDTVNTHVMETNLPPPAYTVPATPRRTERPTRRRTDPRQSIYDYEDLDDSGALYIDEAAPPPPASHKGRRKPKGIKITIPAHVFRQDEKPVIPGNFSAPKNGIESLLQASVFTGSSDNQERDAVAGMLSIGQSYGLARAEPISSRRSVPATEAPPIRAVHRDDEYVYPSLDMSSDEEDELNASASRKTPLNRSHKKKTPHSALGLDRSDREDESWSPRGRLGRLLPRLNRPARRGSRREAVQAALRAARLRGVQQEESVQVPPVVVPPSPVAPLLSSPPASVPPPPPTPSHHLPIPHRAPMLTSTPLREPAALTSLKKPYRKKRSLKPLRPVPVQHILPSPTTPKVVKFKKGMKTAKQRLGKILKIHKMMC